MTRRNQLVWGLSDFLESNRWTWSFFREYFSCYGIKTWINSCLFWMVKKSKCDGTKRSLLSPWRPNASSNLLKVHLPHRKFGIPGLKLDVILPLSLLEHNSYATWRKQMVKRKIKFSGSFMNVSSNPTLRRKQGRWGPHQKPHERCGCGCPGDTSHENLGGYCRRDLSEIFSFLFSWNVSYTEESENAQPCQHLRPNSCKKWEKNLENTQLE